MSMVWRTTMKRKTKIISTLGPSVDNEVMIGKLIDAGMNVAIHQQIPMACTPWL
jgi:hypothetical protein